MRHLKKGKKLGISSSHRKAMMRNLITALLEHGQIKTTVTRAKEMRKYFDKMISHGKKGDLHARRQALAFVKSKEAMENLFGKYGPLYQERNGGYTRIYKLGNRLGDNAQMSLIQMVDLEKLNSDEAPVIETKDSALKEVKEDLTKEDK